MDLVSAYGTLVVFIHCPPQRDKSFSLISYHIISYHRYRHIIIHHVLLSTPSSLVRKTFHHTYLSSNTFLGK